MKTTVEKAVLLDGLKKVAHFVGKINVFTGVKIEVVNNEIFVSTSDGDSYSTVKIEAVSITQNGSLVVPFKEFNDFLKKSKASLIDLEEIENDKLSVKAANINFKLLANQSYNYPTAPIENMEFITVSTEEYKRILNNTTYACGTSDSRPVLRGVNIQTYNNGIRFVATDSHRLGLYDLKQSLEKDINIIPVAILLEKTLKTLDKTTKNVSIGLGENFTLIKFDNTEIYIKNIDGNYPDTSRLIPDNFKTFAKIDTKETVETLDTLKMVAKSDRNNVVKMSLNGEIELSANDGVNQMEAIIKGEKSGDDLTISYSLVFMTEALKALNEPKTNISFSDSLRPFVLESSDSLAKHLVLPVRA